MKNDIKSEEKHHESVLGHVRRGGGGREGRGGGHTVGIEQYHISVEQNHLKVDLQLRNSYFVCRQHRQCCIQSTTH